MGDIADMMLEGIRKPLSQAEHDAWNNHNYPGTLQLCDLCEEPTGRCEEDSIENEDGYIVCPDCAEK